ncbi:hypothetical protein, partial, partial [Absidia glauca]
MADNYNVDLGQTLQTLMVSTQLLLDERRNSGPQTMVKVPPPPCFCGERNATMVDGWLRSVERYFEFTRLNDDRKVDYAVTLLRDGADVWWRRLETKGEDTVVWEEFKALFRLGFRPVNAHEEARDLLANLRQTDTVRSYVNAFHDVELLLPTVTDDEFKDRFIRGLQPAVRAHVLKEMPKTKDAAEVLALSYEHSMKIAHEVVYCDPRPPQQTNGYYGPQPMDLDYAAVRRTSRPNHYQHQRQQPQQPQQQQQKQHGWRRNNKDIRCYACDKLGHYVKD